MFWKPGSSRPALDRDTEDSFVIHNPLHKLPLSAQRRGLPISAHRESILYALEHYSVLIVVGETGCGKSTQIPQYLFEGGWSDGGRVIGCTQPRRLAAISVATRVAQEMSSALGKTYMTNGSLLREFIRDPLLRRYSIIMLDDIHERTKVMRKRKKDFKVIVCSATINAETFKEYFEKGNVAILSVGKSLHQVQNLYLKEPTSSYLETAVRTALKIHRMESPGDILVFLPGVSEVESCRRRLSDLVNVPNLDICPLHGSLPVKQQMSFFSGSTSRNTNRRCIIATNIAEASVTLRNIRYVVDSGFVKLPIYSSSAACNQRSGRAGRTRPGKYNTIPAMQRSCLAWVVLILKGLHIENVLRFDFIAPPPASALAASLELLFSLVGQSMAEFPVTPRLSKMILSSITLGCTEDALSLAAMLSRQELLLESRKKWANSSGDHMTLLSIYNAFQNEEQYSNRGCHGWCAEQMFDRRVLLRAAELRSHLEIFTKRFQYSTHDPKSILQCGYITIRENRDVSLFDTSSLEIITNFHKPDWVVFHESVLTSGSFIKEVSAINPIWLVDIAPHYYAIHDDGIDAKTGKRKSDFTDRRKLRSTIQNINKEKSKSNNTSSVLERIRSSGFSGNADGGAGGANVVGGINRRGNKPSKGWSAGEVSEKRSTKPSKGWSAGEVSDNIQNNRTTNKSLIFSKTNSSTIGKKRKRPRRRKKVSGL
eukprot:GSMAST32.ASY1.ANO1.1209.1 assembled CDS